MHGGNWETDSVDNPIVNVHAEQWALCVGSTLKICSKMACICFQAKLIWYVQQITINKCLTTRSLIKRKQFIGVKEHYTWFTLNSLLCSSLSDVVILINRKLYAWTWCVNVLKIYINTTLTFKVFQNVTNDGIICNSFS